MISVVLSIFITGAWVANCYMAIRSNDSMPKIALFSVCTGLQYYFMCLYISEYLFKQI